MPLLTLDDLAGNDLILHRTLHRTHLGEQGEPIDLPTWPAVVVKIAAGTPISGSGCGTSPPCSRQLFSWNT